MRVADVKQGEKFDYNGTLSAGFAFPNTEVTLCDGKTVEPKPTLNVCEEANQIAGQGGDRMRDYGHPLDNHQRIADGWAIILGKPVSAEQACQCMLWLKIARLMQGYKRDSVVDIAGYAKCYEMIMDEGKRRASTGVKSKHPAEITNTGKAATE